MQIFYRARFVCLLFFFFLLTAQASVFSDTLAKDIDALLKEATRSDEPGLAVLVTKNGKPLFRKGYGMANMELSIPIQPDMVFRLGSITKQFTAVAVLMLTEQGKLSLEDQLTKYLPDYPVQGKKITIHHLLTHTSGIKSYTSMPEWLPLWRKDMTVTEMIDLFKNEPMEFEPNAKWSYNNSGYTLLGAIIEKASGMTYADFIEKNIFDRLGMNNSYYGSESRIIPKRVSGYAKGKNGYENAAYLSMTQPYAAGSLLSSVDDLALWDEALYTDKLVNRSLLEKAWTPNVLLDGKSTGYGYGWVIGTFAGHRWIEHGGGINGFLTDAIRLPDDRVFVAVLSNNESIDPESLAARIAAFSVGKPIREPVAITLSPESLEKFVGVYELGEGNERYVTRQGNKLFAQRKGGDKYELFPYSETEFFIKGSLTRFRFVKNAEGNVISMMTLQHVEYGSGEIAKKVNRPLPK